MNEQQAADLTQWWQQFTTAAGDHTQAVLDAYQHLENARLIRHVTVHRYICHCCGKTRATVIRIDDKTIARTKDYKLARGVNRERSVESARARNTLDGDRHWPGHTYDVDQLARFGPDAGFDVNCRHTLATVKAAELLAMTRDIRPGHPGKPTQV